MKASLILCVATMLLGSATFAADRPSSCLDQAKKQSLTDLQAERLCKTAERSSVMDCFGRAKNVPGISVDDAISLCQCQDAARPQECASKSVGSSKLNRDQTKQLCKDPEVRDMLPNQCGAPFPPASETLNG